LASVNAAADDVASPNTVSAANSPRFRIRSRLQPGARHAPVLPDSADACSGAATRSPRWLLYSRLPRVFIGGQIFHVTASPGPRLSVTRRASEVAPGPYRKSLGPPMNATKTPINKAQFLSAFICVYRRPKRLGFDLSTTRGRELPNDPSPIFGHLHSVIPRPTANLPDLPNLCLAARRPGDSSLGLFADHNSNSKFIFPLPSITYVDWRLAAARRDVTVKASEHVTANRGCTLFVRQLRRWRYALLVQRAPPQGGQWRRAE